MRSQLPPLKLSRRVFGAAEARHRQSLFNSLAIAMLAFIPVDAYIVARLDPRLILVNIVWSSAFVVASIATRRHGSPVSAVVDFSLAAISSISMVLLVALSGGRSSLLLPWCLVMPVAVSLVARRRVLDSVLSSSICGIATLLFIGQGHGDLRTFVGWSLLVFSSAFISISSAVLHVRVFETVGSIGVSRRKLDQRMARNEREHMEARRLALVAQLAAGVAHEVNTPLAVVKANLGFVRNELEGHSHAPWSDSVSESIGEAAAGVERIRLLIRDLTDLASHGRSAAEDCEPRELVEDAMDLVASETELEIRNEISPGLPAVHVVRHHVVQALGSLLQNAIDAVGRQPAGEGGTVLIRASRESLEVRFDVEDTGSGFDESVFPRLFEPFFTTKPFGSGRGLNLAKARERVSLSGGSISVANRSEGGARVIVRFPVASSPAAALPTPTGLS